MKIFTKAALACALAAGAVMASAETVEILGPNGDVMVTYSATSVTIEGGTITLNNGEHKGGHFPGVIEGTGTDGWGCDISTTTPDTATRTCIGAGVADPSVYCGSGTTYIESQERCVVEGPAPTLDITTSSSTLNRGQTATLTFNFSEVVAGFTVSDISATNGSISHFSGSGDKYTARFTPRADFNGSARIEVSAGSYYADDDNQEGGGDSLTITLRGVVETDGNCEVPSDVVMSNHSGLADWGTNGSMNEFRIPNGKIFSRKVSTGSNPQGAARVKLFGDSGTSSDRRRIWISDCPGGEAISRPSCRYPVRAGTNVEILWTQSNLGALYCDLGTNNDYYLNFSTNETCANGGCWARSQHYLINPLN